MPGSIRSVIKNDSLSDCKRREEAWNADRYRLTKKSQHLVEVKKVMKQRLDQMREMLRAAKTVPVAHPMDHVGTANPMDHVGTAQSKDLAMNPAAAAAAAAAHLQRMHAELGDAPSAPTWEGPAADFVGDARAARLEEAAELERALSLSAKATEGEGAAHRGGGGGHKHTGRRRRTGRRKHTGRRRRTGRRKHTGRRRRTRRMRRPHRRPTRKLRR